MAVFNFFLSIFLFFSSSLAFAQEKNSSLEEYLAQVTQSSEELRALEMEVKSLRLEIAAREIELSPTLDVELNKFWDDRPSLSTNPQNAGQSAVITLEKPMATGTTLSLVSNSETIDYRSGADEQNLVNWQMGVSQSLWQNAFGRQTALRRKRDNEEFKSRYLELIEQRQSTLIEYEELYWNIAYAQKEVKIRMENLERSRRILAWIEERLKRFAAENTDLLQAQALVASRELQLQLAQDNLETLTADLKSRLAISNPFVPNSEELSQERDILSLPVHMDFAPTGDPVLIETLQSKAQTKFLENKAKLEADKLKPVLDVGYTYGQQGASTSYARARRDAGSQENHYHQIGVLFSMPLDFVNIHKANESSRILAKAQSLRASQLERESIIRWDDLSRTIAIQKKRVETARSLANFQNAKSIEERQRYEKGKTTAFAAITFEQEAAESELLVLQLMAQLRRTEAQARLYMLNFGTYQ